MIEKTTVKNGEIKIGDKIYFPGNDKKVVRDYDGTVLGILDECPAFLGEVTYIREGFFDYIIVTAVDENGFKEEFNAETIYKYDTIAEAPAESTPEVVPTDSESEVSEAPAENSTELSMEELAYLQGMITLENISINEYIANCKKRGTPAENSIVVRLNANKLISEKLRNLYNNSRL